jgi:hypothetical protein
MQESKFDKLFKEAFENDDLNFSDEADGTEDLEFQDGDVSDGPEETEVDANEMISELLTLKDTVTGLLAKLGYTDEEDTEDDESLEDLESDTFDGEDDIESLEKEEVEFEDVTGKKEELQKKSKMKANNKTGELDGANDTARKEGQEKHYKFVKVKKPEEKTYKTTKGS